MLPAFVAIGGFWSGGDVVSVAAADSPAVVAGWVNCQICSKNRTAVGMMEMTDDAHSAFHHALILLVDKQVDDVRRGVDVDNLRSSTTTYTETMPSPMLMQYLTLEHQRTRSISPGLAGMKGAPEERRERRSNINQCRWFARCCQLMGRVSQKLCQHAAKERANGQWSAAYWTRACAPAYDLQIEELEEAQSTAKYLQGRKANACSNTWHLSHGLNRHQQKSDIMSAPPENRSRPPPHQEKGVERGVTNTYVCALMWCGDAMPDWRRLQAI